MSKYRRGVDKSKDKKVFTKTADRTKALNFAGPMRGGIRL